MPGSVKNRIFVKGDAKASRFLVDLNGTKPEPNKKKKPGIFENVKKPWFKKRSGLALDTQPKTVKNSGLEPAFAAWQEEKNINFPSYSHEKNVKCEPLAHCPADSCYPLRAPEPSQAIAGKSGLGADLADHDSPGAKPVFSLNSKIKAMLSHPQAKRLAFYPLFKTLFWAFTAFFKFSYFAGWLSVFLLRFVLIALYRLIRFPFKVLVKKTPAPLPIPLRTWPQEKDQASELITKREEPVEQKPVAPVIPSPSKSRIKEDKPAYKPRRRFWLFAKKERVDALNLLEKLEQELEQEAGSVPAPISAHNHSYQKENLEPESKKKGSPFRRRTFSFAFRPAIGFLAILLAASLPLKAITYYQEAQNIKSRILGESEEAIAGIKIAKDSALNKDYDGASAAFAQALDGFKKAQDSLSAFDEILSAARFIPQKDLRLAGLAPLILEAGEISSQLGLEFARQIEVFQGENYKIKDIYAAVSQNAQFVAERSARLRQILGSIDPSVLPEEYQGKLAPVKDKADLALKNVEELGELTEIVGTIFGFQYDKRYLLVFQNNTELRASGGFIGSYAILDFRDAEIINLEVPEGGSYDTEGGLTQAVEAPEPLWLVNPQWHFWDANWWPDWPKTARKLQWFVEKSAGPTTDGVISFTPTVLEKMLGVIGPLEMPDYGLTVTSENFWEVVQMEVEKKNLEDKDQPLPPAAEPAEATESEEDSVAGEEKEEDLEESKPKKIIGDMMSLLISKLTQEMDKEKAVQLFNILVQSLDQKHILLYFNDEKTQNKIAEYGWDGGLKQSNWDYLMVVNSNIAGQKTDRVIRQTIYHKSSVAADGSVVNEVRIKREHTGEKWQVFTGVRNVDWMRVYVPEGSELLSATGFDRPDTRYFETPQYGWTKDPDLENERLSRTDPTTQTKIYSESGKTVFANWSMVDPGQTEEIVIRYRLPFKLDFDKEPSLKDRIFDYFNPGQPDLFAYSVLIENQPGQTDSHLVSEIGLPPGVAVNWDYRNFSDSEEAMEKIIFDTDKYWAFLLEKTYN